MEGAGSLYRLEKQGFIQFIDLRGTATEPQVWDWFEGQVVCVCMYVVGEYPGGLVHPKGLGQSSVKDAQREKFPDVAHLMSRASARPRQETRAALNVSRI